MDPMLMLHLSNVPIVGAIVADVSKHYKMLRYILKPDPQRESRLAVIARHEQRALKQIDVFSKTVIDETDESAKVLTKRKPRKPRETVT